MGLLDTYAKLQAIRGQQEAQKLQELQTIVGLANAIKTLDTLNRQDAYDKELAGISPFNEVTRPTSGLVNLPEGYDVADPTSMTTTQVEKPLPQMLTEQYNVARKYRDPKAIDLLKEKRNIEKEEKPKYVNIRGTTAFAREDDPTQVVETGVQGKPEKPVNIPAWMDSMAISLLGSRYDTPEGRKEFADYLATPKGRQEAITYQTEYAKRNIVPGITYLQTNEGFVPMPNKGPGVPPIGQPTGFGKPIPTAAAEKIGGIEGLLNDIKTVKDLYGWDKDKKGKAWVGPAAGRIGGIEEKYLGTASDEQVRFYAYVRDMKDALLRARSGAQINEQEYARLVKFLPDEMSPDVTFEGRLQRFEDELNNVLNTKKSALSEGGYGRPQGKKIIKRNPGETIDAYKKRTGQ